MAEKTGQREKIDEKLCLSMTQTERRLAEQRAREDDRSISRYVARLITKDAGRKRRR